MNPLKKLRIWLLKPLAKRLIPALMKEYPDETISLLLEELSEKITPKSVKGWKSVNEELDRAINSFPSLAPYRMYLENTIRNKLKEIGVNIQ